MEGNLSGALLSILVLQILLPIVLVYGLDFLSRQLKLYKQGDLSLEN
jgi:hypothetical protein